MTYVIAAKVLKVRCNGCRLTIEESSEGKTNPQVLNALWAKVEKDGWTADKREHHYCGDCSKKN